MHARESRDIQDIHFDIPCGRRNYLEEIERYFKATIPGSKSTQYNIVLRNTGITNEELRKALEERIAIVLANSAPVYSKLNKIKWVN
jgi:diaminopimelate decarboxylase